MKPREFIIEKLNSTLLFEMAHDQQTAKKIVTSFSQEIFEHLVKIYSTKSTVERINYWIRETNNKWLKKINNITLKPKNHRPSYELLTTWMIEDSGPTYNSDYLIRVLKSLQYEYGHDNIKHMNIDDLLVAVNGIIISVCEDIADGTFVHLGEYIDATRIVSTSPCTCSEQQKP